MNLRSLALSATLLLAACLPPCLALAADTELVEKQANDKIAQAKKSYCDSVNATADEAIKKYEALLKQETAAGHNDAVQTIGKKLERLKELKLDPFSFSVDENAEEDAIPASSPNSKVKIDLRKRMRAFYISLVKEDYEGAKEYLDPKSIALAPADVIQGYLKIMSGTMMAAGIKKESQIDIKDLTLTPQRNIVKVTPRWQNFNGDWGDGQAQYWVLQKGKWYLGDEKELSKKFK